MCQLPSMKPIGLAAVVAVASVMFPGPSARAAKSFYKEPPLFVFTHPNEKAARQTINRFGPVGLSIELRLPPVVNRG